MYESAPKVNGRISTPKCIPVKKERTLLKKVGGRPLKRKNYPKKALTAYNIFFKQTREKILTEHGRTDFQEMVRKIAALWKEITPEDRNKFNAIALRDLDRYKEEVNDYEQKIVERKKQENEAQMSSNALVQDKAIDLPPIGIDAKVGSGSNPSERRNKFLAQNAQVLKVSKNVGQGTQDTSNTPHALSSNELHLAQHRLKKEGNAREDLLSMNNNIDLSRLKTGISHPNAAISDGGVFGTSTGMQLYRQHHFDSAARELESMKRVVNGSVCGGIATTLNNIELRRQYELDTSIEIAKRNRLALLSGNFATLSHDRDLREQNIPGTDPTAAINHVGWSKSDIGKCPTEVLQSIVNGEKLRLIRSSIHPNGIENPYFDAAKHNDIRQLYFLQRGSATAMNNLAVQNQIATSNETQMLNHSTTNDQMMKHLIARHDSTAAFVEAELRKRVAMDGARNQIRVRDAELQQRLLLGQNQGLLANVGGFCDDLRLREEIIHQRQRERLLNHLSVGTSPSLPAGLSRATLEDTIRRHSSPDG